MNGSCNHCGSRNLKTACEPDTIQDPSIVLYPGGFSENGMIIKEKIFTSLDLIKFYQVDNYFTQNDLKCDQDDLENEC